MILPGETLRRRVATAAIVACFALLAACATTGLDGNAPLQTKASEVPAGAGERITIGRSTKADVAAALGGTATVRFDSGYEVWVYRMRTGGPDERIAAGNPARSAGTSEYVILFDPSGVVSKTRMRTAPLRAVSPG